MQFLLPSRIDLDLVLIKYRSLNSVIDHQYYISTVGEEIRNSTCEGREG